MRKCCFFDILFLYCFPSFVNRVMSTDYQIVTALHWNIVKNMKFSEQHIRTRLLLLFTIIGQIAYIYGYRMVFFNTPFYLISLPLYFPVFHSYPGSFYIADDAAIGLLQ